MRYMNVLLTCSGRRNYLLQAFRAALGSRGGVFAADANAAAPTIGEADRGFVLPRLDDPDYIDALLDVCRKWDIGLLVPLNDYELPLLAAHRDRFADSGIIAVVSSPEAIETCLDKWLTYHFLTANEIDTPKTYLSLKSVREALAAGEIHFPLVVKPRWGSGSQGIEKVDDWKELALAYALAIKRGVRSLPLGRIAPAPETVLIQEFLTGEEHGLDVLNDLTGRHVTTIAKRKLLIRCGETDRAAIVGDERLTRLGAEIGKLLGHIGNLDCDVFVGEQGVAVLELNPRFGGGYPFSHCAGADFPAALLAWARGGVPDPEHFCVSHEFIGAKCDRIVPIGASPLSANDTLGDAIDVQYLNELIYLLANKRPIPAS